MGRKLLLAEDSLTIRKVFELTLAQTDIAMTVVDNGEDAIRMAGELCPDLVVADVTLPGKSGFEVAAELRDSAVQKPVPVLILSGTLASFDEEKYRKCGAKGVLFKPFESQELIGKVEEILREAEPPAPSAKTEGARPGEEPWDFSDVLDEVEAETGRVTASEPVRKEDLLPASSSPAEREAGTVSFGEFDVSIEEIEEAVKGGREPAQSASHMDDDPFTDAPPPVTDMTAAMDEVLTVEEIEEIEEIMEIEELEEVEPLKEELQPVPRSEAESTPPPEAALIAAPMPSETAGVAATAAEMQQAREQFSSRAQEIFEKVAAETVEKVMWEWMDRFSGEISARIRESVEAVAWEVIPSTAETLIREEISRIRSQSEKKTP